MFDRDRWGQSVADRTLYVTTVLDERADSGTDELGCEPTKCGLCNEKVLPITDDGTDRCPICGFAVGRADATLRPCERIGRR